MPAATDVLVIGGGVAGLSLARACLRAGMSVRVVDRGAVGRPGAGRASPGLVGALAPHAPEPWTEGKAFQLHALRALGPEAARLAEETGRDPGWAPRGRVRPLPTPEAEAREAARAAAACARWAEVLPADPPRAWLAPAPQGWLEAPAAVWDDLTARLDPRRWLAALRAAVEGAGGRIEEGVAVDLHDPRAAGSAGAGTGAVVIAAGTWSFGAPGVGEGGPEKGQAALLRARAPADAPVIGAPGLWIVPQADGVAVGSTSERGVEAPGTDARLDAVIEAARALCPPLRGAEVAERWWGLRPRAATRRPVAGRIAPGLWALTGGFKIGFGLSHLLAEALAAEIAADLGGPSRAVSPALSTPAIPADWRLPARSR